LGLDVILSSNTLTVCLYLTAKGQCIKKSLCLSVCLFFIYFHTVARISTKFGMIRDLSGDVWILLIPSKTVSILLTSEQIFVLTYRLF
jgi:hypothetical protein